MNQYAAAEYNHKARWYSYYYQFSNILEQNPKRILEIGIGSGITTQVLKENGIEVTTLDNDPKNNPDIVGDVLRLPFEDNTFDVAVAFAMLEHIPFSSFSPALKEMSRVGNGNVIISLPDHGKSLLRLTFKLPFIKEKNIQLILEPGRYIAAPAGKLHTEIISIYDNNIIVNASVYNSDMDALIVPVKLLIENDFFCLDRSKLD